MGAALALGTRGLGRTAPNPCVGCIIVKDGRVVGRGWTQPGGRPHAEAMAVAEAGEAARGATAYVTLEPCAAPGRGPACAEVLIEAGIARVVAAIGDPFPAVDGKGLARLRAEGIDVTVGPGAVEATRSMAGFLTRQRLGRPHVTLKLALSLDGAAAMGDGRSQWITGAAARAHAHVERASADAILVGRGTWEADAPKLDVRLPGLEDRSPLRVVLSTKKEALSPHVITLDEVAGLPADRLLVEGGMATAASFLRDDLVDRLLIYRAPVLIGGGRTLGDIGLGDLSDAHGRWTRIDSRRLGSDTLDVYERVRG
ncbi:bifunctional diaminohydroxyphosphoribosylaminopyrimidine deaminase/5-amino-6-(5-phosphoribosylamino)uracil reductase RibD [Sphingomonas sp. SUN039]|uniref:bifunctional diaminohydroxyphosphoribosylaminopyrimidine deaminase/5-amino-6-(5-phosphoribosylamino)uracil reductase RibD n=1 Tax=Sphingomonas sp. SUN039 TaxID=2937787 RepID=UPI0021642C7A|nr:bifunctional diaminohydroxyphosphoribosylaminopyrimidine deaminase/5-amino-6-(5-phosphoribosylamino)uracil reductase RibD [Sphingomonas sp. SUN039]UVO55925.1 bifunctional diaminohydroxyphosphoribosylaminopyrimidine deaminase/5-amino-6-(5-phosphoribosylamino)uracil reductase RibD [Sphingomonas sp. SUN039]